MDSISSLNPYSLPPESLDRKLPDTEETRRIAEYGNRMLDETREKISTLIPSSPSTPTYGNTIIAEANIDSMDFITRANPEAREAMLEESEKRAEVLKEHGLNYVVTDAIYDNVRSRIAKAIKENPNLDVNTAIDMAIVEFPQSMQDWLRSAAKAENLLNTQVRVLRENVSRKQKEVGHDKKQIEFLR